jgi:tRNA (guanine37-N1)-methyltransferase
LPGEFDEVPGGYEIIGKIAHLNLREKFWKYKKLIGQAILDVNLNYSFFIRKVLD